MTTAVRAALLLAALLQAAGCYSMRLSSGGGRAWYRGPRLFYPGDVAVPAGYRIELVASDLSFPTGIAFDADDRPHVVEAGYSAGEAWASPRLLRLEGGRWVAVATNGRNGPWNGLAFHDGAFYVSEGGTLEGGRILRIRPDGRVERVFEGLPSLGDHRTTGPAAGPDGKLYFGQGTMTNAGVVGDDNALAGWSGRFPGSHDVPCRDVVLAGENFETGGSTRTGAYQPYGTPGEAGRKVYGALRCNGAVFRLSPEGGEPELVAWGLRYPFGLAFSTTGALYVTDRGYEERGSRKVWGAGDLLWKVSEGAWYGWPDWSGDRLLADPSFTPPGGARLKPLLTEWPGRPPKPAAVLPNQAGSGGLDFSRNAAFGHVGEAFIAQSGDLAPLSGKVLHPVGFKVVRFDPRTGVVEDFAVNRGYRTAPASKLGSGGLERPIAVRFNRAGTELWIVDYGVVTTGKRGPVPHKGTGAVWRIIRL